MGITKKDTGLTFGGKPVYLFRMVSGEVEAEISTFAAGLRGIYLPKDGEKKNIVLRFEKEEDYFTTTTSNGVVLAPNAGRICLLDGDPVLHIDGIDYPLSKNERGSNNLHGGADSAKTRNWDVKEYHDTEDGGEVTLEIMLEDGLEGYPGNRKVTACWTLDPAGLHVKITAVTDKKTYMDPACHPYFNLSGDMTTYSHHDFYRINADRYVTDDPPTAVPLAILPVDGTAFDLREGGKLSYFESIGEPELVAVHGYNNGFVFNETDEPQIHIENENSGFAVDIRTNAPSAVICSNPFFYGVRLEGGLVMRAGAAVAVECQEIPNEPNLCPDTCRYLEPGEEAVRTIDFLLSY